MAGRDDAARIEWQTALKLVERGLADQPADAGLLRCKGELLTYLGDYDEAQKALNQAEELSGRRRSRLNMNLRIAEGQLDAVMDTLESQHFNTAAELRLDPHFDPLRGLPRFKSLLARAEADPKRSPRARNDNASTLSPPASRN